MGSPSALRKLNDRAALYALLESGPMSRLDLEKAIGVSRPAAAELLRRLEEAGLTRPAGYRPGGPGPSAQLWAVQERAAFAAGVDIGHSGIDIVIGDLNGTKVGECTVVTSSGEDPAVSVRNALGTAARRAGIRRSQVRQVGVGISASVDPATGMISHAEHIAEWTGFDVQARLAAVLKVPVTVENDVNLVLSDESIRGCATGCKDVLLLWMDQGIATAVIADGRLQRGFHGSGGEMGLVPIAPGGPLIDDLLSSVGALATARERGIQFDDSAQLFELARSHAGMDDELDRFLSDYAGHIGDVLISPVAVLDPELIILSGRMGTAGGVELAERVRERIHAQLAHRPKVVPGTGYDSSVRQGALDEALRRLRETVFEDARRHQQTTA